MAKTNVKTTASDKVFGGSKLQAGNYIIVKALITEEPNPVDATKTYDLLQVVVKDATTNVECDAVLPLNGIWRPRRDADGRKHQAGGNFITALLASQTGKSFTQVAEYITATYAGKTIALAYDDYPSASHNGYASVVIVNLLG